MTKKQTKAAAEPAHIQEQFRIVKRNIEIGKKQVERLLDMFDHLQSEVTRLEAWNKESRRA